MSLERWGKEEIESGRGKRLFGSAAVATAGIAVAVVCAALVAGRSRPARVEKETVVTFAPQAPPPPPPVETPKPAVRRAPSLKAGPRAAAVRVPTNTPRELPREADPSQAEEARDIPFGDGDVNGVVGANGGGANEYEAPLQMAEVTTAPVAVERTIPEFPEEARRAGVEATIVVRFIVMPTGEVTDVRIVEGHPLFDTSVKGAVRAWRFRPATLDGRVVSVVHKVRIPFRLRRT